MHYSMSFISQFIDTSPEIRVDDKKEHETTFENQALTS